jgi:hypothetical protein
MPEIEAYAIGVGCLFVLLAYVSAARFGRR